ncbi:MAG: hypothetical protein PF570_04550 [Candidatus Cloacimonetes bacterium]|jgi:spore cortex formation protein SpoVR/YcgB (stage V sporulation)|nr:hypothetical protein [Candidatus Cloacimonadota bacterium]
MINYMNLCILFFVFIIIRILINISKYFYLRKVLLKQNIMAEGVVNENDETKVKKAANATEWLESNQIEIKRVVLKTGLRDLSNSYMEPMGLGYAQRKDISALDNITYLDLEMMQKLKLIFKRAKGFYKKQALKNINPIFWIEVIIFLPREILKYFSVEENVKLGSAIVKVLQVIYWIGSLLFMYLNYVK